MKLKTRIIIVFVGFLISIIILAAFFILNKGGKNASDKFNRFSMDGDPDPQDPELKLSNEHASKVEELVKKYSVDFDALINDSPWVVASNWVTHREIYPQEAPELGAILNAMATYPIELADVGYKGTQLKLSLKLRGGQRVAFKPKWYSRDELIAGSPYEGRDRHNGEIAGYYLNRMFEFQRTPLVVGRTINLETEILPVASKTLKDTFFEQDKNTCFYGKCLYCKGPADGVCADDVMLEGIVILWLPSEWKLKLYRHPWGRTYRKNKLARWETDDQYCKAVLQTPPYDKGPRLLDILDTAVFDYLIGNADRHHYEVFENYPESMLILLDNGKSFGNHYTDERSILAPIYQCCRLRRSTWEHLMMFKDGILSSVLRQLLSKDPLSPILTEPHFEAIDRRLTHIFKEMQTCFETHGESRVLIQD